MSLPVSPRLAPMEAESVDALPKGRDWVYEPKWDGFRALAFRDGDTAHLLSRRQKPLGRFFPEMVAALRRIGRTRFVLDGELLIRGQPFESLQLRLHPAASRIAKLAQQMPATLICFDLLVDGKGRSLLDRPFGDRRRALEELFAKIDDPCLALSPMLRSAPAAERRWLGKRLGVDLDGIVAKRLDLAYEPGGRVMQKFKRWKTVDCVVGGVYMDDRRTTVESLLFGLYDRQRRLTYVGRSPVHKEGRDLAERLRPLFGGPGFTGERQAGGKSRWSDKEHVVVPLQPSLVAEVAADHITGNWMRHGARILRWREDKAPEKCTLDQLSPG